MYASCLLDHANHRGIRITGSRSLLDLYRSIARKQGILRSVVDTVAGYSNNNGNERLKWRDWSIVPRNRWWSFWSFKECLFFWFLFFFFFFGEEGFLTWRRLTFFVCFFNVRDVLNVAGFIVSIRASELR